jgi:hypothetical protein
MSEPNNDEIRKIFSSLLYRGRQFLQLWNKGDYCGQDMHLEWKRLEIVPVLK